MKIRLLILFFFLSIIGNVSSQFISEVVEDVTSTTLSNSIIRKWKNNYSIICGVDKNKAQIFRCHYNNYYAGSFTGVFGENIQLPSEISHINDLRILGDYAYFCGQTSDNKGFIAFFNINSFFSTNVPINWSIIQEVTQLDKLAAYYDSYNHSKVVAIGKNDVLNFPNIHRDYIIVEVNDILLTPTCYYANLQYNDVLHEVIFTPSGKLCFVEKYIPNKALGIRLANPDNVINDPTLENVYYYPSSPEEVLSPTHSATIDDLLTVSFLDMTSSGSFSTKIRHFDLTSMDMINAQEFVFDGKSEPWDFIYYHFYEHKAVLLQPFEFPAYSGHTQTNFIFLDLDNINPYVTDVLYHLDQDYYSVDQFGFSYFEATGGNRRYQHNCSQSLPSGSTCPAQSDIKVNIINTLPKLHVTTPISPQISNWANLNFNPSITTHNGYDNCYER